VIARVFPALMEPEVATNPSSSGLSRGSIRQLAPEIADGWMVGTSPTMTMGSVQSMREVLWVAARHADGGGAAAVRR